MYVYDIEVISVLLHTFMYDVCTRMYVCMYECICVYVIRTYIVEGKRCLTYNGRQKKTLPRAISIVQKYWHYYDRCSILLHSCQS